MDNLSFKNDTDSINFVIGDLLGRKRYLNDWECQFVESIKKQIDNGNNLTENQLAALSGIWEKY